jgi:hypothetical protein
MAVFALMESSSKQGKFAVRRLESDPNYLNLEDRRDRAFARLILTTAERRQGQIDKVIKKFVKAPKRAQVGGWWGPKNPVILLPLS